MNMTSEERRLTLELFVKELPPEAPGVCRAETGVNEEG